MSTEMKNIDCGDGSTTIISVDRRVDKEQHMTIAVIRYDITDKFQYKTAKLLYKLYKASKYFKGKIYYDEQHAVIISGFIMEFLIERNQVTNKPQALLMTIKNFFPMEK